jgi:hypothetical protein
MSATPLRELPIAAQADHLLRTALPLTLALVGLPELARTLRMLPPQGTSAALRASAPIRAAVAADIATARDASARAAVSAADGEMDRYLADDMTLRWSHGVLASIARWRADGCPAGVELAPAMELAA